MDSILDIVQIIIGILLVVSILLQAQGAGLGAGFGGGGDSITRTRRGAEKGIFTITVVLSALFIGVSALRIFL